MGIDMSSAFDTIKRSVLLELLADAGCSEDDIRLVRYLLSCTKLKIKVRSTVSGEFIVTIGAFQGDSLETFSPFIWLVHFTTFSFVPLCLI